MKKFAFRLETVLKYQRQNKRQAEMRCLRTQHLLALARNYLADVEQQLIEATAASQRRQGRVTTPDLWISACRHVDRLGQLTDKAREEVTRAEGEVEQARKRLADVTSEVEALLTLRGEELRRHRAEAAHRDQLAVDEVVMRRWGQERRAELDILQSEVES